MTSHSPKDIETRIEEQVADWVLRLDEGHLSDDTLTEWRTWISTDPRHGETYQKMARLWGLADQLEPLPSTASTGRRVKRRGNWFNALTTPRWISAAAAVAALGAGLYAYLPDKPATAGVTASYQTRIGEHKRVTLADGSVMELGAHSSVSVHFDQGVRQVHLQKGEALFQVDGDPAKPFTVTAGAGIYQVLGTTFSVHIGASASTLTVVEGLVQARSAETDNQPMTNYPQLSANQTIRVSDHGDLGSVTRVDPNTVASWRKGMLSFVDATLADVVMDLNRYSQQHIHIVDKSVSELRYTGTVSQRDIGDLLTALPDVFPVKVSEYGNNLYISILSDK